MAGCTKSLNQIESGENLILPFRVIITRPGVYSFNCLRFQIKDQTRMEMSNPNDEEENTLIPAFDEDELIPIQLTFVVTHVSDDTN